MTGTLYQPPTWADLALERTFPDLEDVTMSDALPGQISEAEQLRLWHERFGSYDEQMTVSISRNAIRVGLITWAASVGTVITPQIGEGILSHIEAAMKGGPTND